MSRGEDRRPARRPPRGSISLVVLTLAILSFVLWKAGGDFYQTALHDRVEHVDYEALRPGGLLGHGYGIAGTVLILTNLLYLLRRRLARWSLGSMTTWLNLHVFTGLVGTLLIVFHSAFQLRTPIALATAASLAVVVLTGIVGRYLYALTPQPNRHELERSLAELDDLAPGSSASVRRALASHEISNVDVHAFLLVKIAAIPRWISEARTRGFEVAYVVEDVRLEEPLGREDKKRFRSAKKAVRKYATREVLGIGAASLLQSWRGFHRMLAVLLVLLVPIHIGVAWIYGYRWIFSQ